MPVRTALKALLGTAWTVRGDEVIDQMTPATDGVVDANKPVVVDANKAVDVLTVTTLTAGALVVSGAAGTVPASFNYISTLVTQTFFVASRAMKVTSIIGRPRVAGSGGACTLAFFKAPSGTAVGSGTALHTGTYNVAGTADTNQSLTLSVTASDLLLAAGDSIGYVLTGTATSAVGSVTVTLAPA